MCNEQILYEIKEIDMLILRKVLNISKQNNYRTFSPVQGRIVKYLLDNEDKKVFQRDLEQVLGVRRSTISGILQTMEKNNIIKRVSVKEDARVKEIIITDRAREENKKIQEKFREVESIIAKDIDKEDLNTFLSVTKQIKRNLKEGND